MPSQTQLPHSPSPLNTVIPSVSRTQTQTQSHLHSTIPYGFGHQISSSNNTNIPHIDTSYSGHRLNTSAPPSSSNASIRDTNVTNTPVHINQQPALLTPRSRGAAFTLVNSDEATNLMPLNRDILDNDEMSSDNGNQPNHAAAIDDVTTAPTENEYLNLLTDVNSFPVTASDRKDRAQMLFRVRLIPFIPQFQLCEKEMAENTCIKIGRFQRHQEAADSDNILYKSTVVSRKHAQLYIDNNNLYIKDTKSLGGTFLNNVRLSSSAAESRPFRLTNGDIIQFGVDYRPDLNTPVRDKDRCVEVRLELLPHAPRAPPPRWKGPPRQLDCCICLSALRLQQYLFVAPCGHAFHYLCSIPLVENKTTFTCPLCRDRGCMRDPVTYDSENEGDENMDATGLGGSSPGRLSNGVHVFTQAPQDLISVNVVNSDGDRLKYLSPQNADLRTHKTVHHSIEDQFFDAPSSYSPGPLNETESQESLENFKTVPTNFAVVPLTSELGDDVDNVPLVKSTLKGSFGDFQSPPPVQEISVEGSRYLNSGGLESELNNRRETRGNMSEAMRNNLNVNEQYISDAAQILPIETENQNSNNDERSLSSESSSSSNSGRSSPRRIFPAISATTDPSDENLNFERNREANDNSTLSASNRTVDNGTHARHAANRRTLAMPSQEPIANLTSSQSLTERSPNPLISASLIADVVNNKKITNEKVKEPEKADRKDSTSSPMDVDMRQSPQPSSSSFRCS